MGKHNPEYLRARAETRPGPEVYLRSKMFTDEVKRSTALSGAEKQQLCAQAWSGDLTGARKSYARIVGRLEGEHR